MKFDPKDILSKVNKEELLKNHEVDNDFIFNDYALNCVYCHRNNPKGILLNDKSFLCLECFNKISKITYPEKYEKDYRQYLINKKAYKIAKKNIKEKLDYSKIYDILKIVTYLTIGLIAINIFLIIIPIISILLIIYLKNKSKLQFKLWKKEFNEPQKPLLYNFNNPKAELTEKDKLIFKIFNNWPGYPPYWEQLKKMVAERDNYRCQVSGCPSRLSLNIHHIKAKSKGGKHIPSNLVTLCSFHHALEPSEGHEMIWRPVREQYFTIVRSHYKKNPVNPGHHLVRAHVRRLILVTKNELDAINEYYHFSCPICGSFEISFNIIDRKVIVTCHDCKSQWSGAKKLTEEVGPRLAEFLTVNQNNGSWKANWQMLENRTSVFSKKQLNIYD